MDKMTMRLIKKKRKATTTTIFLLPAFGMDVTKYEKMGFINCYLSDKDRDKVNDSMHIYFLFKPEREQTSLLMNMVEKMEEQDPDNSLILDDYDYEGGYVVLVLKLNEKYRKDYELFLKGKYSQFSNEFKDFYPEKKIIDFSSNSAIPPTSLQWLVVNKDPRLKKWQENEIGCSLEGVDEYWTIPDQDKTEVLDIMRIRMEEEKITKLKD